MISFFDILFKKKLLKFKSSSYKEHNLNEHHYADRLYYGHFFMFFQSFKQRTKIFQIKYNHLAKNFF